MSVKKATFLLKSDEDSFLRVNPTHVGITNSFGKFHWVNGKSLTATKSEYFEKYSEQPWGTKRGES